MPVALKIELTRSGFTNDFIVNNSVLKEPNDAKEKELDLFDLEKMYLWEPDKNLNALYEEIQYVIDYAKKNGWTKNTFHDYFKSIEKILLENLRNTINTMHKNNINKLPEQWINYMKLQWHMMSLFRDFHDYMCGRDKKHYIRTDDCRRFIIGIERGLSTAKFIKPVHRILCGENTPKQFTHKLFKQFN